MLAYRVLEAGGGAEGVTDRELLAGEGAKCTARAGEVFLGLFSCSFSDMAMASCKSSSSRTFCSDPAPPDNGEEELCGAWDSWARELRRYSGGRSLSTSAAAALTPSLQQILNRAHQTRHPVSRVHNREKSIEQPNNVCVCGEEA